jgi:hypothetical protein
LHKKSPLTKEDIAEAVSLFYHVIIPVLTVPGTGVSTGAVLNIRNHSNTLLLSARGGKATERQFQNLEQVVHRQDYALDCNPEVKSTWLLRNHRPNPPQSGAIRTPLDDRLAMAGLTWTWQQNQTASLWLAQMLRRISQPEAFAISALSGQRHDFKDLHQRFSAGMEKLSAKAV